MKKSNKILFSSLFIVAIVLMCTSFITITRTFSYTGSTYKTWDVYLNNLYDTSDTSSAIISNNRIDANISLNEGETYKIYATVNNDGNIDALLKSINSTNLNNIKIGTSDSTNNTYYVSDYIDISITYDNNIDIKEFDVLNKSVRRGIIITFTYKDLSSLSKDKRKVLDSYISSRNITFNYYLELNYGENK